MVAKGGFGLAGLVSTPSGQTFVGADVMERRRAKRAEHKDQIWRSRLEDALAGRPYRMERGRSVSLATTTGRRTHSKNDVPDFVGASATEYAKAVNVDKILKGAIVRNRSNPTVRQVLLIDDNIEYEMLVNHQRGVLGDQWQKMQQEATRRESVRASRISGIGVRPNTCPSDFAALGQGLGESASAPNLFGETRRPTNSSGQPVISAFKGTKEREFRASKEREARAKSISKLSLGRSSVSTETEELKHEEPLEPLEEVVTKWDTWLERNVDILRHM